jgi:hypothetical protein
VAALAAAWWSAGRIVGYDVTFVHQVVDLLIAGFNGYCMDTGDAARCPMTASTNSMVLATPP